MSLTEVALASVVTGCVLAALGLGFCRLGLDIVGTLFFRGRNLSEFWTVSIQVVICVAVAALAAFPLYGIVQARFDVLSIVLGGPLMGTVGAAIFLLGGAYRWGKPPEYMWSIFGGFVVYGVVLHILMGWWRS